MKRKKKEQNGYEPLSASGGGGGTLTLCVSSLLREAKKSVNGSPYELCHQNQS